MSAISKSKNSDSFFSIIEGSGRLVEVLVALRLLNVLLYYNFLLASRLSCLGGSIILISELFLSKFYVVPDLTEVSSS